MKKKEKKKNRLREREREREREKFLWDKRTDEDMRTSIECIRRVNDRRQGH